MADAPQPPTPELAELAALLGPADARELTQTFLHDTPRLIAELTDSSAAPSGPSVQQIAAHSLKSTASLVGANALSGLAGRLEARMVAGGPPPAAAEVFAIEEEYKRVALLLAPFAES